MCPSTNATAADFQDWESNLIIPARRRQKVPPRHSEKGYLYATGRTFTAHPTTLMQGTRQRSCSLGFKKKKKI